MRSQIFYTTFLKQVKSIAGAALDPEKSIARVSFEPTKHVPEAAAYGIAEARFEAIGDHPNCWINAGMKNVTAEIGTIVKKLPMANA
jgi:hypothetical protein